MKIVVHVASSENMNNISLSKLYGSLERSHAQRFILGLRPITLYAPWGAHQERAHCHDNACRAQDTPHTWRRLAREAVDGCAAKRQGLSRGGGADRRRPADNLAAPSDSARPELRPPAGRRSTPVPSHGALLPPPPPWATAPLTPRRPRPGLSGREEGFPLAWAFTSTDWQRSLVQQARVRPDLDRERSVSPQPLMMGVVALHDFESVKRCWDLVLASRTKRCHPGC